MNRILLSALHCRLNQIQEAICDQLSPQKRQFTTWFHLIHDCFHPYDKSIGEILLFYIEGLRRLIFRKAKGLAQGHTAGFEPWSDSETLM